MHRSARIRLALIGVGSWGMRAHLPSFAGCDDVQIVALVDPRIDLIRPCASRYRVPAVFADAEALFDEIRDLDAVVIAAPTDTHHRLALRAIEAGAHVLCEKPLAFNVAQAREMADAISARGRISKMGFLFRYSPVVERMKQLIDEQHIGDVQLFESLVVNAQFIDPETPRHWKMQRSRANGGVFVEYGVHSIDLALWLGGPLASVVAHGVTLIPQRPVDDGFGPVDVDDVSSWIGAYRHGGQALFRTGWASLPIGGGGVRVYGTKGSLAWQLDPTTRRSERLVASTHGDPEPRVLLEFGTPFDPGRTDEGRTQLGLLAHYNQRLDTSFVRDIRTGSASPPSFEDGLAAQRVLAAIRTSLDERRWAEVRADT